MSRGWDDETESAKAGGGMHAREARAWKLVVAYDGTDFSGWQVQPGRRTVQGELTRAVFEVTGERVLPQGSGRTDAGVHAEGQAVSLGLRAAVPAERLRAALNRRLPQAIRVLEAAEAEAGFHARSGVLSKTYEYRLFARQRETGHVDPGGIATREGRILLPWQARYAWDCRFALCAERMKQAARTVMGTHDFSSFAAFDPDRAARAGRGETATSNVRTIFASEWIEGDGLLLYRVSGSGFLHHMVRNLVGTFVEAGTGRRTAESIQSVMAAQDRRLAGPTAPPQGLFLMKVDYAAVDGAEAVETDMGQVICR